MSCRIALALLALVLAAGFIEHDAAKPTSPKPRIQRQNGKRWQRLADVVKNEIVTNTRKFLQNSGHVGYLFRLAKPIDWNLR